MISFKKHKDNGDRAIILDTCALIDGRILDISKAGFVPQHMIVPQFVIAELQHLADTGDSLKRERARFGLDVIRDLQDMRRANVTIARDQLNQVREVDDKLIVLAKKYGAMLYTTDYNLNKVAQIEGVMVLNVNELAHALRPRRLPGERVEIKITQIGQDKTQGVGYLEDGTMVVVEKASKRLGQKVSVEFSRILQTQAGKMMFAVLIGDSRLPDRVESVAPSTPSRAPQRSSNTETQRPPRRPRSQHAPSSRRQTPEDSLLAAIQRGEQG